MKRRLTLLKEVGKLTFLEICFIFILINFFIAGASVILACRNQAKADEACERIKNTTKNEKIEVEILNLASLKSTREFVERFKTKHDRLDILVNNAGIF